MEFNFDLLPLIFGLFWFIFVISIITRIGKAVKKAVSSQGKGFDQQTVLSRLEELRKAMEEKERAAQAERGQAARPAAPSRAPVSLAPAKAAQAPSTAPARRSRFEDYTSPMPANGASAEGESSSEEYGEGMTGSLEGTSSESLAESRAKDKYGSLTPFQMELLSSGMQNESVEGRPSEESGTWKADEMCDAWDESENQEGAGLEAQLLSLSTQGEPQGVDLVGGINMKEMADAIVWSEILGRPIALRPSKTYGARKRY